MSEQSPPVDPLANVPDSLKPHVEAINTELERLRAAGWGESSILERLAATSHAIAWPHWCAAFKAEYDALVESRAALFR